MSAPVRSLLFSRVRPTQTCSLAPASTSGWASCFPPAAARIAVTVLALASSPTRGPGSPRSRAQPTQTKADGRKPSVFIRSMIAPCCCGVYCCACEHRQQYQPFLCLSRACLAKRCLLVETGRNETPFPHPLSLLAVASAAVGDVLLSTLLADLRDRRGCHRALATQHCCRLRVVQGSQVGPCDVSAQNMAWHSRECRVFNSISAW